MELRITLNMDNAEFEDYTRSQAVKRIIDEALKYKITTGEVGEGKLMDGNGNTCGKWEVVAS
jgi:hypothetical protein